ncbi:uroporphyrinogen-III synthase [Croceicoccus sp. BE223]|uniref:uroporphyrinogen-III synthase n=1 Tax=Croceicoccus sp. BE223 TaxID=2817716 RepID=UPI00285622AE|nr:uroporphyrinogen-III synthase [Croceicoccus sp. BE223]MDR7104078.1 uroporphyrinogen-III synthase [Croceicoccus sp. BE223]
MIRIIAIRPEPGCGATVALGIAMGLDIAAHPLFATEPVEWARPHTRFDAILLGSANVLRLAGPELESLRHLPAFCVGETTAQAARAAGFTVVGMGSGGLQSVLPLAGGYRNLLRLSGEARVPLDPPPGVRIETVTCYRVAARPIDPALADLLHKGALVLLHSGEAATHFAAEIDRLAIARSAIRVACLAPRIAEAAGTGWAAITIAGQPQDCALLALAEQMCQAAR